MFSPHNCKWDISKQKWEPDHLLWTSPAAPPRAQDSPRSCFLTWLLKPFLICPLPSSPWALGRFSSYSLHVNPQVHIRGNRVMRSFQSSWNFSLFRQSFDFPVFASWEVLRYAWWYDIFIEPGQCCVWVLFIGKHIFVFCSQIFLLTYSLLLSTSGT